MTAERAQFDVARCKTDFVYTHLRDSQVPPVRLGSKFGLAASIPFLSAGTDSLPREIPRNQGFDRRSLSY